MELTLAVLLGLVIGSFLNVCIVRLPYGNSISLPRSHCPSCEKSIAFYDNIPVLSYLLLRGRCRQCQQSISIRYPLVEIATGLTSLLIYLKFGLSVEWAVYFAFSSALIVLALIDAEHRILPDVITLNGIWVGVIISTVLGHSDALASRLIRWATTNPVNPHLTALAGSIIDVIVGGGLL